VGKVSEKQGKPDRRGSMWDWPAELMLGAVVMLFVAPAAIVLWIALFAFGGITLMARRGSFTPRK